MTQIQNWLMIVCLCKAGKVTSSWLLGLAVYSGFLVWSTCKLALYVFLHVMNFISLFLRWWKCYSWTFISCILKCIFYTMCIKESDRKAWTSFYLVIIPSFSGIFWNFSLSFFSDLFKRGNKDFNWVYNIYVQYTCISRKASSRFWVDFFKVNFARGGVTFCIVNGFVTWKEV